MTVMTGEKIRKKYKGYRVVRLFPSLGWFEDDLCDKCRYKVCEVDHGFKIVYVEERYWCSNH